MENPHLTQSDNGGVRPEIKSSFDIVSDAMELQVYWLMNQPYNVRQYIPAGATDKPLYSNESD